VGARSSIPIASRPAACNDGAMTDTAPFGNVIESIEMLRELYREPSELVRRKKMTHLDGGCRAVIEAAPLVFVGTSGPDGACEVSPRGGPPGFVQVLDEQRMAIPDLSGNNLLDTIKNIVLNPHVGLLFVLPGRDETLRVNGRAWLTTEDAVLDGFTAELRRPKAAIGVEVVDAFVHCAKSFRRGQVWDPASWAPDVAPSAAELLTCHIDLDVTPQQLAANLERGYARDLAAERADARV
jgi:PPOX class probable FMN-dependent enzyme